MVKKEEIIYIFDSSAVLNASDFKKIIKHPSKSLIVLSHSAFLEINSALGESKFSVLKENYMVKILIPDEKWVKYVISKSKEMGILNRLSKTDIEVLALGLEFKDKKTKQVFLVTDDYWMQNFAMRENLRFIKIMFKGIRKVREWILKCEYCGYILKNDIEDNEKECPVCGGPLKRTQKKEK